jgi:hypothetical protein
MLTPKPQKNIFKKIILGGVIACVGIFAISRIAPLLSDARVVLSNPPEQTGLSSPVITITGKAIHAKSLSLNGTPIITLPDGTFEQTILLSPGYNSLTFDSTGALGTTNKQTHALVLKEIETGSFAVSSFRVQN